MSGQISISIWLFSLLVAIAVIAVLDRVLIPSTRWFLRRRINRARTIADAVAFLRIRILY